MSVKEESVATFYKNYLSIPVMFHGVALFVFIKYNFNEIKNKYFVKLINFLNKYTFAIYLLHKFILDLFKSLTIPYNTTITYQLLFPFVVISICILITIIIRKIPILKKYITLIFF